MDPVLVEIHKAFINFTKRAEKNTARILVNTFVDSAPLLDILSTRNNQVVYGRRGTGKPHALKYLSERVASPKTFPVYIDLRSIGSNGALYYDTARETSERCVRLVLDILKLIADELYSISLVKIDAAPHPDQITNRLDDLVSAISDVRVVGEVKVGQRQGGSSEGTTTASLSGQLQRQQAEIRAGLSNVQRTLHHRELDIHRTGAEEFHIEFGRVQGAVASLLAVLDNPEIWILIDEWSEIPIDLQPYLADLIRRTLLPINNFVVKIAAIEHRSRFSLSKEGGEYVGLELGADVSADLNLDDFLVFDNDQKKAVEFFKNLIFQHYIAIAPDDGSVGSADELIRKVFTQTPVFEEFVRAVEGVPRDALNLAAKAASKSFGNPITMNDVRNAARDWYQQDKAAVVRTNNALDRVLSHIIDVVIGVRRARAFLFPSNIRQEYIERLFDSRVIHLLKKNISSHDEPGNRYDVFKIDYGCYVDLINTQKAPQGLFETESGYIEVPTDDYRSIRRAILRVDDLRDILNDSAPGSPSVANPVSAD